VPRTTSFAIWTQSALEIDTKNLLQFALQ